MLIERKARDSCRKSGSGETPQAQSDEEAPRTPARRCVPGAEVNKKVLQDHKINTMKSLEKADA
jgi:hypothetical protein